MDNYSFINTSCSISCNYNCRSSPINTIGKHRTHTSKFSHFNSNPYHITHPNASP
ncbi:Protein of unknown function [Gryllus bimaculatus]|nr:Protein of unknown function [Gryllus bimaculatus]